MAKSSCSLGTIIVALVVTNALAHLCIINPHQRGDLDVSHPASSTCFRTEGPCGNQPTEEPQVTLQAGHKAEFKFQQNLNHYSTGHRGYFEFSFTKLSDPQSEDDFEVLSVLPDYQAYHEWTQTNFTVSIAVPKVECSHCVFRFRYISHKPTEPIFHQCVDVAIAQSSTLASPLLVTDSNDSTVEEEVSTFFTAAEAAPAANGFPLAGILAPHESGTGTVEVVLMDPWSGNKKHVADLTAPAVELGLASPMLHLGKVVLNGGNGHIVDGVATVDRANAVLYFLMAREFDAVPDVVVVVDTKTGDVQYKSLHGITFPLSGIHYDIASSGLIGVGLIEQSNGFVYGTVHIDLSTGVVTSAGVNSDELGAYVDYGWSDYDQDRATLHILSHHEDKPVDLFYTLRTLNLATNKWTVKTLDGKAHTDPVFNSFIIDAREANTILALSPGTADTWDTENRKWELVSMNVITGESHSVQSMPAGANTHPVYWGGHVSGFDNSSHGSDNIALHLVGENTDGAFARPTALKTIAADLRGNSQFLESTLPYMHNMVLVG
eukprot:GFYU01001951.1.p1 GENE.GFYU01001951.1~~GFYU01001951.1.p1  ORF type:complete len:563 (-),score=208.14 GFYU01001951.1:43-1689(-)